MKKYMLLFALVLAAAGGLQARTNIYDLRSFYVRDMPLYLTAPDKAAHVLGEPLKREGYLNRRGGYPYYPGMYPWAPYRYGYPFYGYPTEILGTMVFLYKDMVIYFDQDTMGGSAFISNLNIYTPDYPLYYGDTAIRVGDSFSDFADVFPDEYKKALKRSSKDVFDMRVKVSAGAGTLRQKGNILFIFEKGRLAAVQVTLS